LILHAVLTAALLAIVAQSWRRGPGIAAIVARHFGRETRAGLLRGLAAGTAVSYAVPAILALLLLGAGDAIVTMPAALRRAARSIGLPASADEIPYILACLVIGATLGILILAVRRLRGKRPIGLAYRSPLAAREPAERGGAALVALSAGVSEELFFRLALPLAAAPLLGGGLGGMAVATLAFALAHRHQGWLGILLTGVVGGWLAWLYLLTGALWLTVLLHVAIDLHALVLRPWISGAAVPVG